MDSAAAGLLTCEQVARSAVLEAVRVLLPEPVAALRSRPSLTNFVFVVDTGATRYLAKYSFLGMAKTSLRRRLARDGLSTVLAEQRRYVAGANAMAEESEQVAYLDRWLPGLGPPLVGYRWGTLVEGYLEGDRPLLRAGGDDGDLSALLAGAGRSAEAVWQLSHEPRAVAEAQTLAGGGRRVDPLAIFERKFSGAGGRGYLAHLRTLGSPLTGLGRVVAELTDLLSIRPPRPRRAVAFGDLKPEHVLVGPSGSRAQLLDPGVHLGDPALDLARFLCRLQLVMLAAGHTPEAAVFSTMDAAMVDLVQACESYAPGGRELLSVLVAVDALNILSSYLTVRAGEPGTYDPWMLPVVRAATALLRGLLRAWESCRHDRSRLVEAWRRHAAAELARPAG